MARRSGERFSVSSTERALSAPRPGLARAEQHRHVVVVSSFARRVRARSGESGTFVFHSGDFGRLWVARLERDRSPLAAAGDHSAPVGWEGLQSEDASDTHDQAEAGSPRSPPRRTPVREDHFTQWADFCDGRFRPGASGDPRVWLRFDPLLSERSARSLEPGLDDRSHRGAAFGPVEPHVRVARRDGRPFLALPPQRAEPGTSKRTLQTTIRCVRTRRGLRSTRRPFGLSGGPRVFGHRGPRSSLGSSPRDAGCALGAGSAVGAPPGESAETSHALRDARDARRSNGATRCRAPRSVVKLPLAGSRPCDPRGSTSPSTNRDSAP